MRFHVTVTMLFGYKGICEEIAVVKIYCIDKPLSVELEDPSFVRLMEKATHWINQFAS